MADKAAQQVIGVYSTSFSLATMMLDREYRGHIRNLYAMVRVVDELVDGAAAQAGEQKVEILRTLDAYESAVLAAPHQRFHTDPILHAYGRTARECEFSAEHVQKFFHSMRMDLQRDTHDHRSYAQYIEGSAEVIGLLCVSVFNAGKPMSPEVEERIHTGARALGSAFQKINFLRDFAEDSQELGRVYFPSGNTHLDAESKDQIIGEIRAELHVATQAIELLPKNAQAGVLTALGIFSELTDKLEQLSVAEIQECRVRVSQPRKALIAARAMRVLGPIGPAQRK